MYFQPKSMPGRQNSGWNRVGASAPSDNTTIKSSHPAQAASQDGKETGKSGHFVSADAARWLGRADWVAPARVATPERFELPTYGIEIHCSIQLSYGAGAIEGIGAG
jgi:hypothetical protein